MGVKDPCWCTPEYILCVIQEFFKGQVDLDPCSNEYSLVKASTEYKLPEKDGLNEIWNFSKIYVNPPYGRDKERGTSIKCWLKKCSEANVLFGSEVLSLIPVATDTEHWKKYVFGTAKGVCFLGKRVKFIVRDQLGVSNAPQPCCIVYWGCDFDRFKAVFSILGSVVSFR